MLTVKQVQAYKLLNDPSEQELAQIYLDKPMMQVMKMPVEEVELAATKMEVEFVNIPATLEEVIYLKEDGTWTLQPKGKAYGMINDWGKLTGGEYFDFKTYSGEGDEAIFWANIDKLLSILYRPIAFGSDVGYTLEPYRGSYDEKGMKIDTSIYLTMPADILNGALAFFFSVKKRCGKSSLSYLMRKQNGMSSVKSGGGTALSRRWLRMFLKSKS